MLEHDRYIQLITVPLCLRYILSTEGTMGFFPTFVRLLLITIAGTPVTSQQRASDGRVILNIGFLTSKSGRFVSSGKSVQRNRAPKAANSRAPPSTS